MVGLDLASGAFFMAKASVGFAPKLNMGFLGSTLAMTGLGVGFAPKLNMGFLGSGTTSFTGVGFAPKLKKLFLGSSY